MRALRLALLPALAAVLLLGGCDAELIQLLTASPEGAAPSAGTPVGGGTIAATPKPPGERYTPIDLSGETWVSEQPGTYVVAGDRVSVPADRLGSAYLFYRPALGSAFTLRFREPREAVKGELTVYWMLDRGDTSKAGPDGQPLPTGEHKLVLGADGSATVTGAGRVQARRAGPSGPRDWEIAVTEGQSTVKRDGEVFARYDHVPGYHPAPYLAFLTSAVTPGATLLEHVAVTSEPAGARHAVLRQYDMAGRASKLARLNLVYASDAPGLPGPEQLDTLPAMLPQVEAAGGYPLGRSAALIFARSDGFAGGTFARGRGIYLAPRLLYGSQLVAHEMAHDYGVGGSRAGKRTEGWLMEGMADYLSFVAFGRHRNLPAWRAPGTSKVNSYDPPLSETNQITTARDGAAASAWKVYTKGRVFLGVLAAYTSPEDVRGVIAANEHVAVVTGESFLKALELRSGKQLAFLRPGWLVAGAYQGPALADAGDTDKDGLLDYQELAWGSRLDQADTDGDGADDAAERTAGTDATLASSRPPAVAGNGLAGGFWGGQVDEAPWPDFPAEPTPEAGEAE